MKWNLDRFGRALKIVMALRHALRDYEGEARVLLYRVDDRRDGIGLAGSFVGRLTDGIGLGSESANAPDKREFAVAIEVFDWRLTAAAGIRLWFGDQALCRIMGQPIDGKANKLEFNEVSTALAKLQTLLDTEAAFVALRREDQ